ncbi:hypothetical protein KJ682_12420 [bacterium]|nr:hypothetical protein [bacterium]
MMPAVIVPAPDALPLPAPVFLLQILLHLTFLLHLVAMNAMLGGLILTFYARLKGGDPSAPWTKLADTLSKVTPSLVAATVTLGVAPLLFLQTIYGQFFFTSSILMGWGWFSVVVVLIFAYYGTYLQSFKGRALGGSRTPLLGVTLLLFLWIGFMFSNNTSLMLNVKEWAAMYFASPKGLHLNLGDAQLAPRYMHMVLGSVAVAGLMLAWWGRARVRAADPSGEFMVTVGMNAFTWLTLVNILIGLWYYVAQPAHVRKLFMGGDITATALFGVGFVLGIVMVVAGFRGSKHGSRIELWPLTMLTLIQLVTMIMMRDTVRNGTLGADFRPATFEVQPQVLNLVIFAVMLVGGLVLLFWMLRQFYVAWNR